MFEYVWENDLYSRTTAEDDVEIIWKNIDEYRDVCLKTLQGNHMIIPHARCTPLSLRLGGNLFLPSAVGQDGPRHPTGGQLINNYWSILPVEAAEHFLKSCMFWNAPQEALAGRIRTDHWKTTQWKRGCSCPCEHTTWHYMYEKGLLGKERYKWPVHSA